MSGNIAITSTAGILITAGITTLGTILAAVFTNYDKIFRKDKVVTAPVVGDYRPTGDFETEARIFFEVSGTRTQVEDMQRQLLDVQEKQLQAQFPRDPAFVAQLADIMQENLVPLEELLKIFIPVWRKYLTLEQIQELNKFYSTKAMQELRSKNTFVMQDYLPQALVVQARYQARLEEQLTECVEAHEAERNDQPEPGALPA